MIADWRRRSAWDKPTDPRSGDRVIGKANSYALIHTDQEHDVRIEALEGREIGKMMILDPLEIEASQIGWRRGLLLLTH